MKPRLFLDTNVMLDLLGEREPFYEPIAKLATLVDAGMLEFSVSALSYATVNYFLAKFEGLNSNFTDFEDALQYYCALKGNC